MSTILTRQQVRSVDRRAIDDYGMLGLVLMENAGSGCVDYLLSLGAQGSVVVACGKGNNGGDGFVIARHLDNHGIAVRVLLFGEPAQLPGDARANFEILTRTSVPIEVWAEPNFDEAAQQRLAAQLASADWIVDALLGTGFAGAPREPLASAIRAINQSPAKKLAIDIPSGLDCDTGAAAEPTIVADHTCTFVALKPGLLTARGPQHCGEIHVVDIGVPRKLVAEIVAAADAG